MSVGASRCPPQIVIRYTAVANRLFNLGVLFSTVAVCLIGIAWPLAGYSDPCSQYLNLSHQWHLGIDARGADARIEIFNGSYGPYCGSIMTVARPKGQMATEPHVLAFGDTLGIYFRRVPIPPGGFWWTLSLSFVYPLAAALVLPSVWILLRRRRTSLRRGFTVERSPAAV